jgi:ubiquinone/menaquinone biosynthesis C-methylase UbiE
MKQKEIFLESEGDAWFDRNKGKFSVTSDPVVEHVGKIIQFENRNLKIGEVGCGTGERLGYIKKKLGCEVCGIDPSSKAVSFAKTLSIDAQKGTADILPWETSSLDIIVYGFCLYLCDKNDFFLIAAEANRVTKDKAWVILLDFYQKNESSNPYSHFPGVVTTKADRAKMFLWNNAYTLYFQEVFHHSDRKITDDPFEWVSIQVLRKSV